MPAASQGASNSHQGVRMVLPGPQFTKCVVYLDPEEFHTTWCAHGLSNAKHVKTYRCGNQVHFYSCSASVRLGNKAIYRTRMAMKTGGELIVLAPGENAKPSRIVQFPVCCSCCHNA